MYVRRTIQLRVKVRRRCRAVVSLLLRVVSYSLSVMGTSCKKVVKLNYFSTKIFQLNF